MWRSLSLPKRTIETNKILVVAGDYAIATTRRVNVEHIALAYQKRAVLVDSFDVSVVPYFVVDDGNCANFDFAIWLYFNWWYGLP